MMSSLNSCSILMSKSWDGGQRKDGGKKEEGFGECERGRHCCVELI